MFLFFLLMPVCFSITRATTQFTLVTAHHAWSDPFAAVWLFFGFFEVILTVPGSGSRMDTDVDVEV